VLVRFLKHNCIRVFSVNEMIIQKNSFYVLYMLLSFDVVQFLGMLFLCKLYTVLYFCGSILTHRIYAFVCNVVFGVICNACLE
jgi:hypothetical protein